MFNLNFIDDMEICIDENGKTYIAHNGKRFRGITAPATASEPIIEPAPPAPPIPDPPRRERANRGKKGKNDGQTAKKPFDDRANKKQG